MSETSTTPSRPVIVDACRSPMGKGKPGGALSEVHPVELLAQTIKALIERTGIDPAEVDDVIVGCVGQAGEQSATPGRMAWLAAGFPPEVPSTTIERKCGSSQQALDFANQGIVAGAYEIVVVAGVESMSRVPMGSPRMDKDPFGPSVTKRYSPGLVPQGISAELISERWRLTRGELDAFAARSHGLAHRAATAGAFDREIVPIETPDGSRVVADETIRPSTTEAGLSELKPAFAREPWTERYPDLDFKITAGNSSQLTDGASAILMTSERVAERYGLRPRARIHASAVRGDDPILMLTAPVPATKMVLERAGLAIGEIGHFEVNEAFAPVPLFWQKELRVDPDLVNPRGGAIALGHPLGASGCRLMTTMLHAMEDTDVRWGLQTMCEAGGMANATVIERL